MRLEIENDSHRLKEASDKLLAKLKEKGVIEDIVFDVHVGFEEALRNAMIHGNKNSSEKKVRVETEITDEYVQITVEDDGDGFDPETLPDPTLDENLLKEGGRGVYLIKHLMDEVTFEKGGSRIVMRKYFDNKRK